MECDKIEKDLAEMESYAWYDDLQAGTAYTRKGKNLGLRISKYELIDACEIPAILASFGEVDMLAQFPQDYSIPASTPVRSYRRKHSLSGVPAALAAEFAVGEREDDGSAVELPRSGGGWNESMRCSVEIGQAFPSDSIWHTMTKELYLPIRSDDVEHYSIVDALDEPCGSVYLLLYTILNTDALGRQPPHVLKGHKRQPWTFNILKCTPHKDGVWVLFVADAEVSNATTMMTEWIPTWFMKKLTKDMFSMITKDFLTYAKSDAHIRERMKVSARAPLYESIRKRIMEAIFKEA